MALQAAEEKRKLQVADNVSITSLLHDPSCLNISPVFNATYTKRFFYTAMGNVKASKSIDDDGSSQCKQMLSARYVHLV